MNPHSAASAYKEALYENAPPLKIVHMLYEGAIRFLAQAEQVDPITTQLTPKVKRDPGAETIQLQSAELIPLRENDQAVGTVRRLVGRGAVGEVR